MADPPAGSEANRDARREYRIGDRSSSLRRRNGSHAWQGFRLPPAYQPAQVEREVARVLVAVLRIFRQGLVDILIQLRRLLLERRLGIVDDGVHRLDLGLAAERPPACEHFVKHYAQREDIGAMIERPPAGLLRRHVRYRAHHRAGFGQRGWLRYRFPFAAGVTFHQLRETEIQNLHLRLGRDDRVRRLDIPMHDAGRVRRRQRTGDLHREAEGLRQRQTFGHDQLVQ